uniref:Uncharacterized protein n=1 Tax=Clytia hemisphaerica TaxID=252671 RepID=A0A7M5X4M8_9CNID
MNEETETKKRGGIGKMPLIKILFAVFSVFSLLVNAGSIGYNYPSESIENTCKDQASGACIGNGKATPEPSLFSRCWNTKFDQCVDIHYLTDQWNRDDSNCISQYHSVDVCYQNEAEVEVCVTVIYEVFLCH